MSAVGDCCICGKHKDVYEILKDNKGVQQLVLICDECLSWIQNDVESSMSDNVNYMIGDVFGNMWNGGDKFYSNKAIVFKTKEMAQDAIEELSDTLNNDYEWKLKIYRGRIIKD